MKTCGSLAVEDEWCCNGRGSVPLDAVLYNTPLYLYLYLYPNHDGVSWVWLTIVILVKVKRTLRGHILRFWAVWGDLGLCTEEIFLPLIMRAYMMNLMLMR